MKYIRTKDGRIVNLEKLISKNFRFNKSMLQKMNEAGELCLLG